MARYACDSGTTNMFHRVLMAVPQVGEASNASDDLKQSSSSAQNRINGTLKQSMEKPRDRPRHLLICRWRGLSARPAAGSSRSSNLRFKDVA